MHIQWMLKKFEGLSPFELYAVLQLRSEVFVVEQRCIFLDADNKDQECYHLIGFIDANLVAYSRIVPPKIIYTEASIGRVVTSPVARRSGLGRQLLQQSINSVYQLFGNTPIKIGAQLYLKEF